MPKYCFIQDLIVITFRNIREPSRAYQNATALVLDELLKGNVTKLEASRLNSLALSLMRAKR